MFVQFDALKFSFPEEFREEIDQENFQYLEGLMGWLIFHQQRCKSKIIYLRNETWVSFPLRNETWVYKKILSHW